MPPFRGENAQRRYRIPFLSPQHAVGSPLLRILSRSCHHGIRANPVIRRLRPVLVTDGLVRSGRHTSETRKGLLPVETVSRSCHRSGVTPCGCVLCADPVLVTDPAFARIFLDVAYYRAGRESRKSPCRARKASCCPGRPVLVAGGVVAGRELSKWLEGNAGHADELREAVPWCFPFLSPVSMLPPSDLA